jgi:hypothetical protein
MNLVQAVYLGTSLFIGIVLAVLLRRDPKPGADARQVAVCLAAVVLTLLIVGVVSGTFIRHIVQVVPPFVALALILGRSPHGLIAAVPILTFWLGIMVNIWLFLFGIARIFTGTFSLAEIVLTCIIALASVAGIVCAVRTGSRLGAGLRLVDATVAGVLQFAALVASFLPVVR